MLQIYHCVQLNALFCCFFSVTLRLLVINISSFSPAINTVAYYQRDVPQLTRRWPWSTGDSVDNTGLLYR